MKKYSQETVVGIFVVIGFLAIAYMTVKLGNVGFLGEKSYTLIAKFTSVSGLRVGNPVNMLGLEIGRVESFKMDQENQVAVVTLKINNGIEIYDDAIASIQTEVLIGDNGGLVFGNNGDLNWQNVELRIDERSDTREDLMRLGVHIGDFITIDPQPEGVHAPTDQRRVARS